MEIWIPWLLILVGWSPDAPVDRQVERVQVAIDQEECHQMGEEMMASRGPDGDNAGSRNHEYLCIPLPSFEEFEEASTRMKERAASAASGQ